MSLLISGDLRLAKGQPVPIDPFRSNVSLLLHGDGANGSTVIVDSSLTPKTVTAVGNAQISTAQSKFGGASIAFDGSGDYLIVPDSLQFFYAADSFTIEFFYRFSSVPGVGQLQFLYSQRATGADYFFVYFSQTSVVFDSFSSSGAQGPIITAATTHVNDTWKHFALVRNGSNFVVYVDGVSIGTTSSATSFLHISANLDIGRWSGGADRDFNGYIDELRITKGVARYTANFTPPTAPFPDF